MPSRLRRDEAPPYPEYAVAMLRSALDIHQDIGGLKSSIAALQATTNKQGENLEAIGEMMQIVKSLKETSERHSGRLESIETQVHRARRTLTVFAWIGAIVGVALTVVEIYKHFPK